MIFAAPARCRKTILHIDRPGEMAMTPGYRWTDLTGTPRRQTRRGTPRRTRGGLMADDATTLGELKQAVVAFAAERHWAQYHAPKNLAMALAVEAAELMEPMMWL